MRYRYITKVPDFELRRLIPGREEVLNEGDIFEYDGQISASIIEPIDEEETDDDTDDNDSRDRRVGTPESPRDKGLA